MRLKLHHAIRIVVVYIFCFTTIGLFHNFYNQLGDPPPAETGKHEPSMLLHRSSRQDSNISYVIKKKDVDRLKLNNRIKRQVLTIGKQVNSNNTLQITKYGKTRSELKLKKNKFLHLVEDNSRKTEISDIFITVKTTKKYHKDRVNLLLDTWWIYARDQTYFFTDADDEDLNLTVRGHVINTNCTDTHTRNALCCKMAVEFDYYIISNKRWFCHVDDDTYINIPALLQLLQKYNHTEDWYLGKPSLMHPLEIQNFENKFGPKISFWFATGGAGFCISRPLALKMVPFAGGGRLKRQCTKIRLPDDCAIGFIIEHYLHTKLTVIREFHSHLEGLWVLKPKQLQSQITLSYAFNKKTSTWNRLNIPGIDVKKDKTRLRTIHCLLNPHLEECSHLSENQSNL